MLSFNITVTFNSNIYSADKLAIDCCSSRRFLSKNVKKENLYPDPPQNIMGSILGLDPSYVQVL